MIRRIGARVAQNLQNLSGWRTSKRILVIESDDWGSIRMPSMETFHAFAKKGFPVHQTQYNRYDTLEDNTDMIRLLEVLAAHKNRSGQSPCLTANFIVANPAFEKIRNCDFKHYHYEHVKDTLVRYPNRDQVWRLHLEGASRKLLRHQFHGREHLNITRWMKALQKPGSTTRFTFDFNTTYSGEGDYNYMEALDMDSPAEIDILTGVLQSGLSIFESTFGFRSQSFIAPCYTWHSSIEPVLLAQGVKYMQGGPYQYVPRGGFNHYHRQRCYMGQRKPSGLIHLTRNCFFEPTLTHKTDWVDYVLAGIRDAFRWNKPAILCTHRLNFIGALVPENRERNLTEFNRLLKSIVSVWPDIEFMSSDELGQVIENSQHE